MPARLSTIAWACALFAAAAALPARAADTGDLPCKTTQECNEQAAKIGAGGAAARPKAQPGKGPVHDQFYWVNKINKASAVMLVEKGIFTRAQGELMARGVEHAIRQAGEPGGKRPADVLQIERIMTDDAGPEVSIIHAGRSRQDMYATYRGAVLRDETLAFADALLKLRQRMLALAADHVETLMPAYTNGVQAVPITLGHYLLAYEAAFQRDQQRVQEAYARLNRSPMGAGVLSNSIWPLDRERMAQLLGFDGIIENSLDANQVAPFDQQMEAAGIAESSAIRVGALMQDLHTQYHQTRPWLLLQEGSTYTSSSMPQKRNPGLIMRARMAASDVVGLAQAAAIRAHNVTTGMVDYKSEVDELGVLTKAAGMAQAADTVFSALVVDKQRAEEELNSDWTSTMNLAELLLKEHGIPFRAGHGFASDLVSYSRPRNLTPSDLPFYVVQGTFTQTLKRFGLPDQPFPLTEAQFRERMTPGWIVSHTQGTGGPQPAEVRRMLAEAQKRLQADQAWMQQRRARLQQADTALDQAFARLLPAGGAR